MEVAVLQRSHRAIKHLDMPIDGLDVLQELKSQDRTKVIPVVVLTSSREEIKTVESYKLGVNSYVIKPADGKQFAQVIGDIAYYWLTVNEPPYR